MWKISMTKLEDHLKAKDTEPAMRRRIMMHLESWHSMSPPVSNTNSRRQLAEALEAQTGIGWRNFLLGHTAKQLEEWQQRHFDKKGSRNTGRRWAIELAKKLMGVCWDMWQHRNDVLHNDGQNFHRKVELAKADASIREEHVKGKDTLLKQDKFLLKSLRTTLRMELNEKRTWLVSISGARAAWTAKQNETPTFDAERRRMQEWLTEVDQPHLTIQPAEPALLVRHNIAGEEAVNSETPHTTHHTGQADRDTTQAGVGSVQETRTTESDTRGTRPRAGAPQTKKRAHSSTNNKRNNKKAHKGKENKTKRKQKSRTSILHRKLKTPRAHTELHLKITLNSAPQRESTLHRRLHETIAADSESESNSE